MNVGELIIRIGANTGDLRRGVREARREVDSLPDEHIIRIIVDNGGNGPNSPNGNLDKTKGLLIAIASLAPIVAAGIKSSVGALGGLSSMLATATIGSAGFGAVVIATLNDVLDAQKEITKANQDMERAGTKEEKQAALENLKKAYIGLNEGQLVALSSLQRFQGFWQGFTHSLQAPVVVGFVVALEGLQFLLENLGPTINVAGAAIVGILQKINGAMKSSDFQKFFDWLQSSAGNAITTFGSVFLDVMQGVFNLLVAFQPVSDAMQGGMQGLAQSFLVWTQSLSGSQEFKDFLDFTIRVGPQFLTTIQLTATVLMDLINILAPLGSVMIGVFNSAAALISVFLGFAQSTEIGRARLVDYYNAVVQCLNAIKAFLGFQTDATTAANNQSTAVSDVEQAYKDMLGSIGNVGSGLKGATKDAQKFIAAFDEVYQIPDKLDNAGGGSAPSLPPITAPPVPPTTTGGGGTSDPGQSTGGWVDKLLDKLALIPKIIDMPDFRWPTAPAVVTDAIQTITDKIKELQAFLGGLNFESLSAILESSTTNSPLIVAQLNLISGALNGIQMAGLTLSPSFAAMATSMLANVNEKSPAISAQLLAITNKIRELRSETDPTDVAFKQMLGNMSANTDTSSPAISMGLLLITVSMGILTGQSEVTQLAFHAMLDYMQNQINAFQPYISWGISMIIDTLASLVASGVETVNNWNETWTSIWDMVKITAPRIVSEINSVTDAYNQMNAAMGRSAELAAAPRPIPVPATTPAYNPVSDPNPQPEYGPAYMGEYQKTASEAVAEFFKSIGSAYVNGMDAVSSTEFMKWVGEHPELGAGVGAGGVGSIGAGAAAKSKSLLEAFKAYLDGLGQGGAAIPAFASGGIIGSEGIVRVGEGNKPEAIVPLEGGAMNPFADAVANRIGGGTGGTSGGRDVYIGVFDNSMLKSLERALKIVRIGEEQRGLNT